MKIREMLVGVKDTEGNLFSEAYRLEDGTRIPTGPEVAKDMEASRTYANRIFEQRYLATHQMGMKVQELQKQVQALTSEKSRRRHSLGFAYDKDLKRSRESDRLDAALMVQRDLQRNPGKAVAFRR